MTSARIVTFLAALLLFVLGPHFAAAMVLALGTFAYALIAHLIAVAAVAAVAALLALACLITAVIADTGLGVVPARKAAFA